jgi:hypothetical protein
MSAGEIEQAHQGQMHQGAPIALFGYAYALSQIATGSSAKAMR